MPETDQHKAADMIAARFRRDAALLIEEGASLAAVAVALHEAALSVMVGTMGPERAAARCELAAAQIRAVGAVAQSSKARIRPRSGSVQFSSCKGVR